MSTLIRWYPFQELVNQWFADSWQDARPAAMDRLLALDIREDADAYTVVTALPGLSADKINVSLQDGVLTIAAEIEPPQVDENSHILAQERLYGKFSRSITLPEAVNSDAVEAQYSEGVLTLTLPKAPEAKPRQIAIKANGKALPNGK